MHCADRGILELEAHTSIGKLAASPDIPEADGLKKLSQEANLAIKELAQEANLAMANDLEARQALGKDTYDAYLESTRETMTVMRKIRTYLKEEAEKLSKTAAEEPFEPPQAFEEYFAYQGIARGPITFSLLKDSMPDVDIVVKDTLAGLTPPSDWKKTVRKPPPLGPSADDRELNTL